MEKSAPPAARSPRRKDGARKLYYRFELFQAEYPEATVELWAMDEHRLGLKPIFQRVWTPVGVEPTAEVNWRFQWFWVYGASTSDWQEKHTGGSGPWLILLFLTKCWPT